MIPGLALGARVRLRQTMHSYKMRMNFAFLPEEVTVSNQIRLATAVTT